MTTLAQYIQGLTGNVTQTFGHNGETGVDIGLPYNTPVYAANSGTVVGSGYYGGGGVETIRGAINAPNYNGVADVYYQHLSTDLLTQGQTVQAGQLIGYSGGQLGYGNHPSSAQFSTGPHIEIGINAPYGGMWGSGSGPNVNPLPWLQNLPSLITSGLVGGALPAATGVSPTQFASDPVSALTNAITGTQQTFVTGARLAGWLLIALVILGAGVWLLIPEQVKDAAGDAVKSSVTGAASGASKVALAAA